MKLKYLFVESTPGKGHRLYILAPWGDVTTNPALRKLYDSLNCESMWGGSDRTYGPTYETYVLGWEFTSAGPLGDGWGDIGLTSYYTNFHNEFTWEAVNSLGKLMA
jgi:hypothetical protein